MVDMAVMTMMAGGLSKPLFFPRHLPLVFRLFCFLFPLSLSLSLSLALLSPCSHLPWPFAFVFPFFSSSFFLLFSIFVALKLLPNPTKASPRPVNQWQNSLFTTIKRYRLSSLNIRPPLRVRFDCKVRLLFSTLFLLFSSSCFSLLSVYCLSFVGVSLPLSSWLTFSSPSLFISNHL